MSMKAYLAEKYMSGPKADAILSRVAPPKKKKRKANPLSSAVTAGAVVQDEDGGWGDEGKDEGDDLTEAVIEKDRGFKKRRITPAEEGSGWATLQQGYGIKEESPPAAADEQPMIVDDQPTPFTGGLITASQLKKALPKAKPTKATQEEIEEAQETIYRDPTGKKIDTKAARADAARLKREREEKEAQKMEWGKGLVQKEEQEKKRLEIEKQKGKGFARYADDVDLNEELKAKDLWNDPAAAFLTVCIWMSYSF